MYILGILIKIRIHLKYKNVDNLLQRVVKENDKIMLKLLLKSGANIDEVDKDGNTLVMIAAKNNNKSIVKFLVKKGADLNLQNHIGDTAFSISDELGYRDIALSILKKMDLMVRSRKGDTSLHIACRNNDEDMVRAILAREGSSEDLINTTNLDGNTPWMLSFGNSNICKRMLDNGADTEIVNKRGQTSFMLACKYGNKDLVNILLSKLQSKGQFSNEEYTKRKYVEEYINRRDQDGNNALSYACESNNEDIYRILLTHGADKKNINNKGQTMLMLAVICGNKYVVGDMLYKNNEIYRRDNSNRTALDYAKELKQLEIEKMIEDEYNNSSVMQEITEQLRYIEEYGKEPEREVEVLQQNVCYLEKLYKEYEDEKTPIEIVEHKKELEESQKDKLKELEEESSDETLYNEEEPQKYDLKLPVQGIQVGKADILNAKLSTETSKLGEKNSKEDTRALIKELAKLTKKWEKQTLNRVEFEKKGIILGKSNAYVAKSDKTVTMKDKSNEDLKQKKRNLSIEEVENDKNIKNY